MIKDKKGFLLTEETLKIIIAVIGLGVLIYFLVAIFYSNVQGKKEIEAAGTIERISETVNVLNSTAERIVNAIQPQGWFVFSFVEGEDKPNSCFGEDCVCVCDEVYFGDYFERQINECSKSGTCLVAEGIEKFEPIEIVSYEAGTTSLGISENSEGKLNFRGLR